MQKRSRWGVELLVLIMASVALIIMVVGGIWTLSPDDGGTGGQGHGGMDGDTSSFPIGTALFIFGGLLFIILLFAGILLRSRRAPEAPEPAAASPSTPVAETAASQLPSQEAQKLAIKLLSGDERKMFRRIVEGGGEVLQRELVAEGTYSKAKVTRLLDKLERKDLIVRSRYGSTNKIRVSENLGK